MADLTRIAFRLILSFVPTLLLLASHLAGWLGGLLIVVLLGLGRRRAHH